MLYLTCTTITSVDLAYYGVSRARDWVSVGCDTTFRYIHSNDDALFIDFICLSSKDMPSGHTRFFNQQ